MSGKIVCVLPVQKFEYEDADLAATKSVSFLIIKGVDVSQYKEIVLCARLHEQSASSDQKITLDLYNDGSTDEDPRTEFLGSSVLTGLYFSAGDSYPEMQTAVVVSSTDNIAAKVALKVTLTQGSQVGDYSAVVSADLILRD